MAHTDSRFELETLQPLHCAPIRASSHSVSVSSGPWPSTCGWRWWRTYRRLSKQVIRARHARAEADELADRILGMSGRPVENTEERPAPPGRHPPCGRIRSPASPAATRPGRIDYAGAGLAQPKAECPRDAAHRGGCPGTPGPGCGKRDRSEHHHQHAMDVLDRLARVLRERQPGR